MPLYYTLKTAVKLDIIDFTNLKNRGYSFSGFAHICNFAMQTARAHNKTDRCSVCSIRKQYGMYCEETTVYKYALKQGLTNESLIKLIELLNGLL